LTSSSNSVTQICTNKGIDVGRSCTNNAADGAENLTSENLAAGISYVTLKLSSRITTYHPFTSKDVTQSSNEEESDTTAERPSRGDPVDIW
jgi:hypothetical protein